MIQLATILEGAPDRTTKGESGLHVTYNPRAITPAREMASMDLRTEGEIYVVFLGGCMTGWDLMDGDTPVPITRDSLEALPNIVLSTAYQEIREDRLIPPTKRASSKKD